MPKQILDDISKYKEEFVTFRHDLHQHPEVSFEEKVTAKKVATKLKEWGYEVFEGIGKTGVVARLSKGTSKKTIGLRADMDALPMQEHNNHPWRSATESVFHGCGHDGHTATLLFAAKYIAKDLEFDGTVHLIFQPAEETLGGAKAMIEDGLFEKFPCDAVFASHNMAGFKEGHIYVCQKPCMASSDTVHITIQGKGAHGAQPEKGIDATVVACSTVMALQTIVSRNVPPKDAAVITVGCIESGKVQNIVNEYALLKLTVRAYKSGIRSLLLKRIEEVAKGQAESYGATATVEHTNGTPAVVSDPELVNTALRVSKDLFGKDFVHDDFKALMGSEDFSFMIEATQKGCYVFIGSGDQPGFCNLHNPEFDYNDAILVPSAAFFVAIVKDQLS